MNVYVQVLIIKHYHQFGINYLNCKFCLFFIKNLLFKFISFFNYFPKSKIQDIHDVLEVTVYDEDKDRVEFLGKIAIPLLKVKNGEKHWYALKDKKLRHRVKGHIFLECWITYNPVNTWNVF